MDRKFEIDVERVIDEFEEITSNAERVQKETLKKILEENSNVEYLLNHGLDGRTDLESFKSHVPIASYSDLEHYIQRIADGETSSILTGKPITTLSLSTGTSQGKPKIVPFNDALLDSAMQNFRTSFVYRNREYPIKCSKALQFVYGSKQLKTKGGLDVATSTTHMFRSPQYKTTMKAIQPQGCSPEEVIFGPDFHQSLYCHLLCGLLHWDEVQFVSSTFSHSIVQAFRTFENVWEDLCTDIRVGVLSSKITVPSIRTAMSKILKPNPELADLIHGRCSGLTNWYGLIPALFPNAKYIYGVMTGSMESYLVKLRHYGGELPLVNADYGTSEGWIGTNVNPKLPPEETAYCVLPNVGYFEFIPLRDSDDGGNGMEADPVGLTQVKIGEDYEILVTNFTGFYRYRLGDIVKVKGFHNATPELQFICRRNILLNVNVDRNTEKDLQIATDTTSKLLSEEKLELVDFTSHVDMSTDPGHYVIFWEINGDPTEEELLSRCCNCLDLSFVDTGYVSSRKVNAIGPLELRVLKRGTFQKLFDRSLGMGAAASQFKMPRFVGATNKEVLQILNDNVSKSYFSSAY